MGAGVHIHSKVVVIDPFGEHPVVMTGSHNLGYKASTANDDNLMIIEGNAPLAAAYAANIITIYQAYRWNAYVEAHRQDPKVWHGLVDNDSWQSGYLTGDDLAEIQFWLGSHQPVAGSIATPQPPSAVPPHISAAPAAAPVARKQPKTRIAASAKKTLAKKKRPAKRGAKKSARKSTEKKAAVKKKTPVKKKKAAKKKH